MTNPAFGPYGEPAFTVDYGNSGLGKSMDKLRTFPLGLYLAPPGGLKPAVQQLGYKPQTMVVQTLADCHAAALDIHQRSLDYEALVIDDASIILDNTATALAARYKNGIQLHGKVLEAVKAFRQLLRQMGLHAALNFHERQPATYDGEFFPGGPKLPSKGGTKEFPHIADLVTRAKREPNRRPWTGVYECDPHSVDYFQKDRFGVCPAVGPLNTGEILRGAGYTLRRLPGLEWMDEIAERIAADVESAGLDSRMTVGAEWARKLQGAQIALPHIAWVVQDGLDRAELRILRREQVLESLGLGAAKRQPGQIPRPVPSAG